MNKQIKYARLVICAWLFTMSPQLHSAGLGSLLDSASALTGNQESTINSELLNNLTSQLGVSDTQATGGTAALLALAQQQLSGSESSLLNDIIPSGNSASLSAQLLQKISSMDSVKSAFSALGLDASMIEQFAPIILQYVGNNGGSSLVDGLSKIWS
ncbi:MULTISPECIES: DUF2780 domain-containing protein [unclassified Agarivorans]|uniref:DUF2780 domain-containing protein n=2 Tax=Agarivorans TaxID=261825 RepID=UPI003D7C41E3